MSQAIVLKFGDLLEEFRIRWNLATNADFQLYISKNMPSMPKNHGYEYHHNYEHCV